MYTHCFHERGTRGQAVVGVVYTSSTQKGGFENQPRFATYFLREKNFFVPKEIQLNLWEFNLQTGVEKLKNVFALHSIM